MCPLGGDSGAKPLKKRFVDAKTGEQMLACFVYQLIT